jgi:hypothetical protein
MDGHISKLGFSCCCRLRKLSAVSYQPADFADVLFSNLHSSDFAEHGLTRKTSSVYQACEEVSYVFFQYAKEYSRSRSISQACMNCSASSLSL